MEDKNSKVKRPINDSQVMPTVQKLSVERQESIAKWMPETSKRLKEIFDRKYANPLRRAITEALDGFE